MSRGTRRALWSLGLTLLVLGGLGAYGYFLSTTRALERAESFEFRRMQVARVSDDGAYRFFFVTNRVPEGGEGPIDGRLARTRGAQLRFGLFETEIAPTLGLGMWLNASGWLLEEEIRILRVRELERRDFLDQVRAMVDASPQRALLMLVHGYRTDFDFALRGTAFLAHILDINAPVLVFDWPADQGDSLRGYRRAREVATGSASELADTLHLVSQEIRPGRLWLIANSLGGEVAVEAVSRIFADPDFSDPESEIDQLVLTAPDVDYERFHGDYKEKLAAVVRNTTVYVSSNDRALLISRVINRGRRLGQSTLSKADAELFDEVEGLLELVEPGSERVALVDVTPINRTRNFHNFSLEVPEYFDDVFLRLTNADEPQNRLRYRFRTPEGKSYSVLTRGR